jgi:hypothetical protein
VIEAVDSFLLQRGSPEKDIGNSGFEQELKTSLSAYLNAQESLNLMPPTVVMLSLIGVKDHSISNPVLRSLGELITINRDLLLIPEVLVEEYGREASDILRPIFDTVWQSCGWESSPNYNNDGDWVERG